MKTKDWLTILVVATGGYLVYRAWQKAKAVTAPVANIIGDTVVAATLPGKVDVTGSLILPEGTAVKWSTVTASPGYKSYFSGDALKVVYKGNTYTVDHRDSNGNYVAVI